MNWQEWRQNDDAKRKTTVFAVAVAGAILLLIFPWNYFRKLSSWSVPVLRTSKAKTPAYPTGTVNLPPQAVAPIPARPLSPPRQQNFARPGAPGPVTEYDLPPSLRSPEISKFTLEGVDVRGVWLAQGVIPKREGACTLNLEIRENPAKDGDLRAYTTLACPPYLPLWADAHPGQRMNRAVVLLKGRSTTESILTGSVDGESVVFSHVQETLGADAQGCALESLNLRDFGDQRLAVKWSEGACEGGELILRKVKN